MIFDLDKGTGSERAEKIGANFACVDMGCSASVAKGLEAARDVVGIPRIFVNCAGIAGAAKTVSRRKAHDPELFNKVIRVNLIGSFNCASQAAAMMVSAEPVNEDGARGVIIKTASVAAFEGQIGQLAYSASKGGIVGMTLPIARDLANKGVRVCTIAPGLFLAPLLQSLPEEVQALLGCQVPFPSWLGNATEFSEMVNHITQNSMLNGEIIRLDGAIRMAPR